MAAIGFCSPLPSAEEMMRKACLDRGYDLSDPADADIPPSQIWEEERTGIDPSVITKYFQSLPKGERSPEAEYEQVIGPSLKRYNALCGVVSVRSAFGNQIFPVSRRATVATLKLDVQKYFNFLPKDQKLFLTERDPLEERELEDGERIEALGESLRMRLVKKGAEGWLGPSRMYGRQLLMI